MIISSNQLVILGAPGCGKTTSLLHLIDECLQMGILPHELALVSFSRRAANEALERACKKFSFKPKDFPYFRTLHSLAFNQLGLRSSEVMTGELYQKLGKVINAPFTNFDSKSVIDNLFETYVPEKKGDVMLFLDSLGRSQQISPEEVYHKNHAYKLNKHEFLRFCDTYSEFRRHYGLLDFTDMLLAFTAMNAQVKVKVAFIDEAQDLSNLQWQVCQTAFSACERVVIAGDDDQAIFRWAGADVDTFLSLGGTKLVLSKSHRLPSEIHGFARKIVDPIKERYVKEFSARENGGVIKRFRAVQHIPLSHDRSWLWLARNTSALSEIERHLRKSHVVYQTKSGCSVNPNHIKAIITWESLRAGNAVSPQDYQLCLDYIKGSKKLNKSELKSTEPISKNVTEIWHDALTGIPIEKREYYLGILRAGRKLTDPPLHTISTIHGAKGMEADNVVLLSIMGKNTHDAYMKNQDDERRVFYVGVTRAKQNLFVVDNQAPRSFKFPYF